MAQVESRAKPTPVERIVNGSAVALFIFVVLLSYFNLFSNVRPVLWICFVCAILASWINAYRLSQRAKNASKALKEICHHVEALFDTPPALSDVSSTDRLAEVPDIWGDFLCSLSRRSGFAFKRQLRAARAVLAELDADRQTTRSNDQMEPAPNRERSGAREDFQDLLEHLERGRGLTPKESGTLIAGLVFAFFGLVVMLALSSSSDLGGYSFFFIFCGLIEANDGLLNGSKRRKQLLDLLRDRFGQAVQVLLAERGKTG